MFNGYETSFDLALLKKEQPKTFLHVDASALTFLTPFLYVMYLNVLNENKFLRSSYIIMWTVHVEELPSN